MERRPTAAAPLRPRTSIRLAVMLASTPQDGELHRSSHQNQQDGDAAPAPRREPVPMVDVQSRVQPHQPVQAKDRASHRQDDPGIAWHVRKQRLAGVNYPERRVGQDS